MAYKDFSQSQENKNKIKEDENKKTGEKIGFSEIKNNNR